MTKPIQHVVVQFTICGILGFAPLMASADCWSDLPNQARQGLHISLDGPFPMDSVCQSLVSADFNGDGQTDYALLVTSAEGAAESALMLVVKSEQWTLQVVRKWPGSASPTSVRLLPAGRYLRAGSILEGLEYGEVPSLVATRVGLQAGSWAYFWQGGRWVSVRLAR
jgi:hypothetical protein